DVETVYSQVVKDNPSFSKTTVYNCLQALAECNLVTPVKIDFDKIRYDANTDFHGHFKCEKCGKIYDFYCTLGNADDIDGFEIRHRDVYYSGLCDGCKK
ncbi:MAG: Fur family transcriptional regulator, partial [Eubacterium sp.]